jgi:hypothetical protein
MMITINIVWFIIGIYCLAMYGVGYNVFISNGNVGIGTIAAWIFSPILVPVGFLILLIAY